MSLKKVLVTGSTQGIGKAIAAKLAEEGYRVIVHCRADLKKAQSVMTEIGAFGAVIADLSDAEQTSSLYEKTGAVDVLVLNASVQVKQSWEETDDDAINKQLGVNVISTLKLIQSYYPDMKKNGWGRIITIGSVNQRRNHPALAFYAATKCAVMSLVSNIAKFSAPYGVTVNNISPGAIITPRNADVYNDDVQRAAVESLIPLKRFGTVREIAETAEFLAGDSSSYITGADIVVDGGMSL